ncbi:S4 domain-containing protein YaaA [Halalkalibacter alkalisediminis]|uniref:S4 domain-containing protein YaaA n=1 Tax=Halalkalibacter alkalisediminis TaxID=935616 RepID=A0ABV6NKR8_9BACI|nr:S4 domain-containing protein YaaA [Halalkalibacter alkalisediminis]
MNQVVISTAYITLGQMLKEAGIIDTGGMAKWYLSEFIVYVNGEEENRRGKKLVPEDTVTLADGTKYQIVGK